MRFVRTDSSATEVTKALDEGPNGLGFVGSANASDLNSGQRACWSDREDALPCASTVTGCTLPKAHDQFREL